MYRWTGQTWHSPKIALGVFLAAAAAISFTGARSHPPRAVQASSHRDAPFISEDPAADNTDVYAFVSTEAGRADYVTLIANYVPLQEPANGPNFYKLSDFVTYEINVDTDGDGRADLTYRFEFTSKIVDPGTYLYNTGTILPPPNPADPTSQYVNLNQPQSYTLTQISKGNKKVLLNNVRTAPNRPGPKSIDPASAATARSGGIDPQDDSVAYANLAQMAVHTAANSGGTRAFVGPRAEGFYVDLGTAFDLINPHAQGLNGTSGFNISTLAVEVPKSVFKDAGDTDGIIGVWATASRVGYPVCRTQGASDGQSGDSNAGRTQGGTNGQSGDSNGGRSQGGSADQPSAPTGACDVAAEHGNGVQVSRLSNPLFNEFLDPIKAKDLYNATRPDEDRRNIYPYILNPSTAQGPNTLTQQLKEFVKCTDTTNRKDQVAAWMQGFPAGVVNGFPGNRDTQSAQPAIADEMRLNYNIPPSVVQNRLGVLAKDFAGMPNGRRVGDDAVDILLHIWGGQIQSDFGGTPCLAAAALTDGVNGPDVPFLTTFPYLGTPHDGYSHDHDHNVDEPQP